MAHLLHNTLYRARISCRDLDTSADLGAILQDAERQQWATERATWGAERGRQEGQVQQLLAAVERLDKGRITLLREVLHTVLLLPAARN